MYLIQGSDRYHKPFLITSLSKYYMYDLVQVAFLTGCLTDEYTLFNIVNLEYAGKPNQIIHSGHLPKIVKKCDSPIQKLFQYPEKHGIQDIQFAYKSKVCNRIGLLIVKSCPLPNIVGEFHNLLLQMFCKNAHGIYVLMYALFRIVE